MSTELAWAAGFFDGEGWSYQIRKTGVQGQTLIYTQIGVAQKDIRPLKRFHEAVGGVGAIYTGGTSNTYQWRVTGTQADAVMELLWDYLSEPKREQYLRTKELHQLPEHTTI